MVQDTWDTVMPNQKRLTPHEVVAELQKLVESETGLAAAGTAKADEGISDEETEERHEDGEDDARSEEGEDAVAAADEHEELDYWEEERRRYEDALREVRQSALLAASLLACLLYSGGLLHDRLCLRRHPREKANLCGRKRR